VSFSAAVCPACSSILPPTEEGETCAFCGTPMVDGRCPVCGSERLIEDPAASARRWTFVTLALAMVLLLGSAWLTRPWAALESTPEPDARAQYLDIPTATLTRTPTPTATSTPTSTPTSTATPTATPLFLTYAVVRGDTASDIAKQFGITTEALLEANDLSEDDILSLGQELRIPTSGNSGGESPTAEPAAADTPTAQATLAATAPQATPQPTSLPPTATPEPTQGPVIHTVAAGEHLGIIARDYGLSQEDIARANNMGVDDILSIGQQLVIPLSPSAGGEAPAAGAAPASAPAATPSGAPVEYIVQEGDLLGRIAIRFGVSTEDLARANNISVDSVLSIGQVLVIPGTVAEPTVTPLPTITPTPASQSLVDSLTGMVGSSTPTPRPPAAGQSTRRYVYARPNLLGPVSGSEFQGADAAILLSWASSGILAEKDWYQLRIWSADSEAIDETLWLKGTSWRLPESLYDSGQEGVLWWKVTVVRRASEAAEPQVLSADSQVYKLIWR